MHVLAAFDWHVLWRRIFHPDGVFWNALYQTVMEGMFADPMYGGNKNKAGWKLIGFPGAIAVHRENVLKYRDKPFPTDPQGIADLS